MYVLPDSNHKINTAGELDQQNGTAGPGYAAVQLNSVHPLMRDRTNSGRFIARALAAHHWEINITYNPLTRNEFDLLYAFLHGRGGGLKPFYVSLPQYYAPKDATMVTNPTVNGAVDAGTRSIAYSSSAGNPSQGDLFTITDSNDSAHTKAYIVVSRDAGAITINPPLARNVATASILVFNDPLIKCTLAEDGIEYSISSNGLYNLSLKLEEVMI
jgi:hypothetical protein